MTKPAVYLETSVVGNAKMRFTSRLLRFTE
jgi:hypothetical protein